MNNITVGKVPNCTHYCARKTSYKTSFGKNMSILGNPFFMKNESQRDKVCNLYEEYFTYHITNNSMLSNKFKNALREIITDSLTMDIVLGCFCRIDSVNASIPRCHCDTIKNYINMCK